MPRDLADLAASAGRTAEALQGAQIVGVKRAALHTTRVVRAEIAAATGGDSRLSGVGKRGAKVGARFDLMTATRNPTAIIKATGPLQLVERDTRAHTIPRQRRRSRRRRYAAFAGRVYSRVDHPGTRGKRPFARGAQAASPQAQQIFRAEVADAVRRGWLGGAA